MTEIVNIRITPAGAGNTIFRFDLQYFVKDHPRGCGEYTVVFPFFVTVSGSPPRVRGIQNSVYFRKR